MNRQIDAHNGRLGLPWRYPAPRVIAATHCRWPSFSYG